MSSYGRLGCKLTSVLSEELLQSRHPLEEVFEDLEEVPALIHSHADGRRERKMYE